MSKFLHGPPKFSRGPPVGDRCFRGLCHLSLQQHEPLNPAIQCHIPEEWNFLCILSALCASVFHDILVQAVLFD
jgi:hypothetical protein